jgi:hypothetical protein
MHRWTVAAVVAQHVRRVTVLLRYVRGYPASLGILALARPQVQYVARLQAVGSGITQTMGPYGAGTSDVTVPGRLPAEEADGVIVFRSPQITDYLASKKHGQVVHRGCRSDQV